MTLAGRLRRARSDEAGFVGGGEALAFGVLTFVVGALLMANAWGVVDAKAAATSAAREAARAYVEAPDERTALDMATAAATSTLAGHGRDPGRADIALLAGRFARCEPVVWQVTYPVPAVKLPWIGGFGEAFEVSARHSEVVDPFRSGIGGEASCG